MFRSVILAGATLAVVLLGAVAGGVMIANPDLSAQIISSNERLSRFFGLGSQELEVNAAHGLSGQTPKGSLLISHEYVGSSTPLLLLETEKGKIINHAVAFDQPLTLDEGVYFLRSGEKDLFVHYSGDCSQDGRVLVTENRTAVCGVLPMGTPPMGELMVISKVVNDDLGDAFAADFSIYADSIEMISAVPAKLPAGEYVVTEYGPNGYDVRVEGDCDANGRVKVPPSGKAECVIVNDDVTPEFGVLSFESGKDVPLLFSNEIEVYINGEKQDDVEGARLPIGAHVVEVRDGRGNELRLGGKCGHDGTVVIAAGRESVCTVSASTLSQVEFIPES